MATTKSCLSLLLLLLLLCLCSTAAGGSAPPYSYRPTLPKPSYRPTYPKPSPYVPKHVPPKTAPPNPFCPRDVLKLGACLNLLGGTGSLVIGVAPAGGQCCAVLTGLTDAEAAACLCTTIKESVLGITTEWSVALSLLVSSCGKSVPDGFKCI